MLHRRNVLASSKSARAARCRITGLTPEVSGGTDQGDDPMTLIKRASNLLLLAATAGAVVGLSAAPAMAATTLHVKVSNGGTYTATASKTVLKDGAISVTCTTVGSTPASKTTGT